jgi:hypothetical protein
MKRAFFLSLFFYPLLAHSQPYYDSLKCTGTTYYLIKVDSSDYWGLMKNDPQNIYSIPLYEIDQKLEYQLINKYPGHVLRNGKDLIFILNKIDSIKLTTNSYDGDRYRHYCFVEYNEIIDCYIIYESFYESSDILLVNAKNGKQFRVPMKMKILKKEKLIIASYIDYVNGGSWARAYSLKNDELLPIYIIEACSEQYLFADVMIDLDQHLFVKCQKSYSKESFTYFKIIKK